jgi:RNA polymerase sigma-70 factor (ECF subfamily)
VAVSNSAEGSEAESPAPSDAELVRAARRGDLHAFDILVQRHQRQATAVAFRLLNDSDDAMEVVQDAFLRAYQKLPLLAWAGRFKPWLMRIVSNLALNKRRARALRKTISMDAAIDGEQGDAGALDRPDPRQLPPDAEASGQDVRKLIDDALGELTDMQREALLLFSVEKLPQKQVAERLGCSVEAVKWHVFAARKKMKEKLKDYL